MSRKAWANLPPILLKQMQPLQLVILAILLIILPLAVIVSHQKQTIRNYAATPSSCIRMDIPAYFSPGSLWQQASAGAPNVAITIMNPNSGPGSAQDTSYVNTVNNTKAVGVKVLGYVHTSYGTRSASVVKSEIDKYKQWYGVTDIFFDEASDQTTYLAYYQDLASYVRQTPGAIVELNPGVYPAEGYMNVADIIDVYEDSYANYGSTQVPSWASSYPASKFAHLVYAAPNTAAMTNAIALAEQRNVGYIYVTNDVLSNPWDTLPSYLSSELSQLAMTCTGVTPTLMPSASPSPSSSIGTDTQPPTVAITSPAAGSSVSRGSRLTVMANAVDNIGVTKVVFYANGARQCTTTVAPYHCSFRVSNSRGVSYTLIAYAYDAAGNIGTSPTISIKTR